MRTEPGRRLTALGLLLLMTALVTPSVRADSPGSGPRTHQVEHGDTLYGIAGRYGVSVGSIVAANGLKPGAARLKPGQRLAIPATAKNQRTRPEPDVKPVPSGKLTAGAKAAPSVRRVRAVALTNRSPRDFVLAVPKFLDAPPPFQWPVEGPLTSTFGRRHMGWHRGIDIKAEPGAPVLAAATGLVIASDTEPRYGNVVKVAHDNGFVTVYAHNERNLVDVGDWVAAGQTIAAVGRTGRATSDHVHFEIRHEGLVYNPLYLLPLPPRVAQMEESDQGEHDDE